jgi:hypothetical protein
MANQRVRFLPRRHRRKPLQELQRLEHQFPRPVVPGHLQLERDADRPPRFSSPQVRAGRATACSGKVESRAGKIRLEHRPEPSARLLFVAADRRHGDARHVRRTSVAPVASDSVVFDPADRCVQMSRLDRRVPRPELPQGRESAPGGRADHAERLDRCFSHVCIGVTQGERQGRDEGVHGNRGPSACSRLRGRPATSLRCHCSDRCPCQARPDRMARHPHRRPRRSPRDWRARRPRHRSSRSYRQIGRDRP